MCSHLPDPFQSMPETAEWNPSISPKYGLVDGLDSLPVRYLFPFSFAAGLKGSIQYTEWKSRVKQQMILVKPLKVTKDFGGTVPWVLLELDKLRVAHVAHVISALWSLCPGKHPRCFLIQDKGFFSEVVVQTLQYGCRKSQPFPQT